MLGAAGGTAWYLNPNSRDWLKRVTKFRYGNSAQFTGSLFVPLVAAERACPLLILLDHSRRGDLLCARFARHCEEHGWIAASSDAFGHAPADSDTVDASAFIDAVRSQTNVDDSRPVVSGHDESGEAALRLAILQPTVYAGAILECSKSTVWREIGAFAPTNVSFFLFTRHDDPNREVTATMKDEMERRGLSVTYQELDGRHEPMERDELDAAFAWLDSLQR